MCLCVCVNLWPFGWVQDGTLMSNMIWQQLEAGLCSALSTLARSPLGASCSSWHAVNMAASRHLRRFQLVSLNVINLCANSLLGRVSGRFSGIWRRFPVASPPTSGGLHPKRLFSLGVFLEPLGLETSPLPQCLVCTLNPLRAHRE